MDDIVSLFVVFFVFKALGGTLKSLFHGDKRNDFRRDRLGIAFSAKYYGQAILQASVAVWLTIYLYCTKI